jgi:hypothetical protein
MLVFTLYIVKQVDKSLHLNVNMIKTNQKKFLDLIPYQQKNSKFEKLFHEDLN